MRIYDKPVVFAGLALFLGLVTAPFWYGGTAETRAEVAKSGMPAGECVESAEWMRANHMLLLNDWRNEVVRDDERTYVNSAGKKFEKSLTRTCLDCHSNKVTKGGATASKDGSSDDPHASVQPGTGSPGVSPAASGTVSASGAVTASMTHPAVSGANAPRAAFCDQCHAQAGVEPYCWACHLGQKE